MGSTENWVPFPYKTACAVKGPEQQVAKPTLTMSNLQDYQPGNWMYFNVILEDCELGIPVVDSGKPSRGTQASRFRGLALTWEQLRVGYFFGGDGEVALRVNAHQLSAASRLPDVSGPQVKPQLSALPMHLQGQVCCLAMLVAALPLT